MNDRVEDGRSRAVACAVDGLFYLLLAVNVVRTLRHAMWRDELQIFLLGANSPTLPDLWRNLRYEAHGALWDSMVWALAQAVHNPAAMQVLHAAIAAAIWFLVYRHSPFTRLEKFLLLLSYFLFFEYFVVSRGYALGVLLGFAFVALRRHRPQHILPAWLLLGLQANINAFVTIWSIALAIVFVLEQRGRGRRFWGGAAVFLALLAFGIVTMMPAPDYAPWSAAPKLDLASLNNAPAIMLGAFFPVDPDWFRAAAAFLADPQHGSIPFSWNPSPFGAVFGPAEASAAAHPLRLAALLPVPVVLCALLTRNPCRVLEFTLSYAGIMLFAVLWHYVGGSRHFGIVFVAFVACVWAARARAPRPAPSVLFAAILLPGAVGGILSLGSEFTTFSQSRNTARWIERSGLADMPLIGTRDAQVSSVAGYLGRPVHYLECECTGTFIVWNGRRQSPLSAAQTRERLARALGAGQGDALLIRNRPMAADELPPGARLLPLESFTGAVTDENYWIYRVSAAKP